MTPTLKTGPQFHLQISPNPTSDIVTISANLPGQSQTDLVLSSISGSQLINKKVESANGFFNLDLNLKHLPQGLYILTLTSHTNRIAKRIIKID